VARKRRKIETPLSRPAPPRSVLVADMFQQRFSRIDKTTTLYRAFATTVFLMIFLRDFTDGALRRRRCNRGDDDKHASNMYKKRLLLALSALGQLSVELSRAKARGFIAPPSGCKKFSFFCGDRLSFSFRPRVTISFQIPRRDERHEARHPRVLNHVLNKESIKRLLACGTPLPLEIKSHNLSK